MSQISDFDREPVTRLINAWKSGDERAREQAVSLLYDPLCQQAQYVLRDQSPGATLCPASLVNELFIRLDQFDFDVPSRYAFRVLTGRAMRNVLISHIRQRNAAKRSGVEVTVTFANVAGDDDALSAESFLDLSRALDDLKERDERCHELCEAHYFAGLTYPELAEAFDISEATVTRDLRFARAWLKSKLRNQASS